MNAVLFRFCVLAVAGWIQTGQQNVIDHLVAENRVLYKGPKPSKSCRSPSSSSHE